jgi:hypothetical protein
VDDAGTPVALKGCNLGNWLLIEPWMLGLGDSFRDQHGLVSTLQTRFGPERTARLLDVYRSGWVTGPEMALIKSFGFNLVRVPFHHGLLADEDTPLVLRKDAFVWLDRAVDLAEQAGVYVILDMHGVPGGQSVEAPTGRADVNDLWNTPADQERTIWLWRKIAERYRNRSVVIAYDLINEPWGDFRVDVRPKLLDLVGKLHDAIREVDPDKLILAPGSLRGITFYGDPRTRGWKNVGFTEHFYPGLFGQGAPALETHARFLDYVVPARRELLKKLDVPYLVGEFNVVLDAAARPEMMRRYYDEFAAAGWMATMWSARLLSPQGGVRPDNWYLLTNAEPFSLPDLTKASYDEVLHAFEQLGTMPLAVDERLRDAMTASEPERIVLASYGMVPAGKLGDTVPGWTALDVSATLPGGARLLADGAIAIHGAGSDLWGNHDEFHFLCREQKGDFAVRNHLVSLVAPHPHAKAGWMLRAGTEPDAAHVLVHAFTDGRVMLAWRAERGGQMQEKALAISGLPVGLGVERKGRTIRVCYTDADGRWQSQPIPDGIRVSDTALLGMIVLSHEETVLASAAFDAVPGATDSSGKTPAGALPAERNAGELLQNASFETAADGADAADRARGWDRWGQWFNREQGWKPLREGGCLLGYHHWQIESAENSGVYQDVTGLKPGTRCTFSVFANRDAVAEGKHGPESVELRIESRCKGRLLNVASQTYRAADIATDENWSHLHVTGTLPADNARVLMIANPSRQTPRDAAMKFDAASLRVEPASVAPVNRVATHISRKEKEETHE